MISNIIKRIVTNYNYGRHFFFAFLIKILITNSRSLISGIACGKYLDEPRRRFNEVSSRFRVPRSFDRSSCDRGRERSILATRADGAPAGRRSIESPSCPNVKVLREKQVITGSYRWLQVVAGSVGAPSHFLKAVPRPCRAHLPFP